MNNQNKRLKICLACDAYKPTIDGVTNVVGNYLHYLGKNNDVCLIAPKHPKYIDTEPNVYRVPSTWSKSIYRVPWPSLDRKLKKYLDAFQPDIIHLHSPLPIAWYLIKYARKRHIPIILTFHTKYRDDFWQSTKSHFMTWLLTKILVRTISKVDALYTVNEQMIPVIREYGLKNKEIGVLPNATDMEPLADPKAMSLELRKELGLHKDTFVMGFVGRIVNVKNLPFIIDVIYCLVNIFKKTNVQLLIVGNGPNLASTKRRVEKLNLTEYVNFIGSINDRTRLAKFYNIMDLFIFPSLFDTDGLVLREASVYGVPALVLKNSTILKNWKSDRDILAVDNDIKKYASKIATLINDTHELKEVGQNAQRNIPTKWDNVINNIVIPEYRKVIANYSMKHNK